MNLKISLTDVKIFALMLLTAATIQLISTLDFSIPHSHMAGVSNPDSVRAAQIADSLRTIGK